MGWYVMKERLITLVKGKHTFYFSYTVGDEDAVITALVEMVDNPELTFDAFDAMVITHQLGRQSA
jgi:hypothetical protein